MAPCPGLARWQWHRAVPAGTLTPFMSPFTRARLGISRPGNLQAVGFLCGCCFPQSTNIESSELLLLCLPLIFFLKDYLKERESDRESLSLLVYSPSVYSSHSPTLRSQEPIRVSHVAHGPNLGLELLLTCYLPRCLSKKLYEKRSRQELN